jgi:hypothetical protein
LFSQAKSLGRYRALYEYTQQTEEELSFQEEDLLDVYDKSDPDWALVGLNGQYGYAPANYIEKADGGSEEENHRLAETAVSTVRTVERRVAFTEEPEPTAPQNPSSPRRSHLSGRESPVSPHLPDRPTSHARPSIPSPQPLRGDATPVSAHSVEHARDRGRPVDGPKSQSQKPYFEDSDGSDGPGLPLQRPGEPPYRPHHDHRASSPPIPPGFRTYPVMEVDSKKKRAATLGVGPNRIVLLPDKSSRPKEEWTVDDMIGYNFEGKHVFLDFNNPTRSLDLHAGSTDNAEEIISTLGELRGVRKATGLDEVIAAAKGGKKQDIGTVLYDFPAQGEDEVSVTAGDEVVILDNTNDEWWLVRRQVNGAEGVVPSSYIERGRKTILPSSGIKESPGIRSEARKPHATGVSEFGASKVPQRRSSLAAPSQDRTSVSTKPSMPQISRLRYRKERPMSKTLLTLTVTEPDASQIRTWTDRTGSFKVEAQFLGCRDGKIHLHKLNGVKIAVPVSKMSTQDVKYVEAQTGVSLDEDKLLSEIMKDQRKQSPQVGLTVDRSGASPDTSAFPSPAQASQQKADYDWFEFFLGCGVDVNNCQRYALTFQKDEMDESSLEDITPEIMRTLGMKEGDILRTTKNLDEKYGRAKRKTNNEVDESSRSDGKSLFTDEHGNLKSSRARPAPAMQTGQVDPKALVSQKEKLHSQASIPLSKSPLPSTQPASATSTGFEDDAWAPKPSKTQPPISRLPLQLERPSEETKSTTAKQSTLTGALSDIATLSLETPPLQPTVNSLAHPVSPPAIQSQPATQVTTGSGPPDSTISTTMSNPQGPAVSQSTGGLYQVPRVRPVPPTITGSLGIPPPPSTRSLSAPQTFIPGSVPAMTPEYTGSPAPGIMGYHSIGPLSHPGVSSTIPGVTTPQNLYQYTGSGSVGHFNAGVVGQPGVNVLVGQHAPGIQPPSGFPQFSSMPPNSGSFGINSVLLSPLVPQPTAQLSAAQSSGTAILKPQPTGPAPPVRFGITPKKLAPQPTGRANLSKASEWPCSLPAGLCLY